MVTPKNVRVERTSETGDLTAAEVRAMAVRSIAAIASVRDDAMALRKKRGRHTPLLLESPLPELTGLLKFLVREATAGATDDCRLAWIRSGWT